MSSFSTESLSDHDREALAVLMADNPEFAAKLADAVAEKVGEKLGEKLVQIGWIMVDVEKRLEKIDDKLEEHDRRLDTLAHNFEMFGQKQDLFSRELHALHVGIRSR